MKTTTKRRNHNHLTRTCTIRPFHEPLVGAGAVGDPNAPFPLTPTLSPGKREARPSGSGSQCVLENVEAPHEPPFSKGLRTILPLPFPRGEGRGEGSFSV